MNLLDALSGIGTVLDTPGAMLRTGLAGENPFAAVFDTDKRVSGRELLERYGLAGANIDQGWIPDLGDLGGFAAEMLLDPTNLLGGAGLAKRMMGISKAKKANRGIDAANALSHEQRAMGFMPEEVARLTKIVDETGQPKRMYHGTANAWEGPPDPGRWVEDPRRGKGHFTSDSVDVTGGEEGYWQKGLKDVQKKALESDPRLNDILHRRNIVDQSFINSREQYMKALGHKHNDDIASHADAMERASNLSDKLLDLVKSRREEVSLGASNPGVLRHFIDSRKPLDLDATYPISSLPRKIQNRILSDEEGSTKGIRNTIRFRLDQLRQPDLTDRLKSIANRDISELFTIRNPDASHTISGWQLQDRLGVDGLKQLDYDAIKHIGGDGTLPHNVVIALDPKNVYLPYIAKELQELQRVASPNSLLASLAGYNALAHTDLETDE